MIHIFSIRCLLGSNGMDVEIKVPPGVCISNDERRLLGEFLCYFGKTYRICLNSNIL